MPVLSTRIVLDCFYLLIFYSEKFSTDVCRLPCAVNVNLNLSNTSEFAAGKVKPYKFLKLVTKSKYERQRGSCVLAWRGI